MSAAADDRFAIVDVLHTYAWALDTSDYAALAGEVFTVDVVADYGLPAPIRGVAAVARYLRAAHEQLDATQHLIGNCTVRVDGERAAARSYALASLVRRGTPGGDRVVFGAYYTDDLVRTGAGWRIRARVARMFFRDGNPAVLRA